jgi:hypothetical protein
VRIGRIILASLAPLLGLSALSSAMATGPVVSNEKTLTRLLLLSVVTPMVESSTLSDRAERPSPPAVIPFTALAETPFKHSVWMVASRTAPPFSPHSQQRSQLRC